MSRQRLPRTLGHGSRSTTGRRSNQPLVTAPGTTSIVWYQNGCSSSRACTSSAVRAPARGFLGMAGQRTWPGGSHLTCPPVRIAFTHAFCWPEVRRGAERFIQELGGALVRRGHEVTILSSGWEAGTTVDDGVRTVRLPRRHEDGWAHE